MEKVGLNKAASLSKEVRSFIDRDPYVRNTLADGLINYSALARKLSPSLEKKMGRQTKEESVIVAIKRYADEINGKSNKSDYTKILSRSAISMQDDVSYALISRSDRTLQDMEALIEQSDWHPGEVRIMIDGPGRMIAIMKTQRLGSFIEKHKEELLDYSGENSLITIREPMESRTTYGVIAEIANRLSRAGISIELISAPPDLHFLVNGKEAEEAYRTIRSMIKEAKLASSECSE